MPSSHEFDKEFYVRSAHTPDKMKYITRLNDHVYFNNLHELSRTFFGHDGYFIVASCPNNLGANYVKLPLFIRNETQFRRHQCYMVGNTDVWFIRRDYIDINT